MQRTRISKGVSKVKWNAPHRQKYQASFTPNGGGNQNYSKLLGALVVVLIVIVLLVVFL